MTEKAYTAAILLGASDFPHYDGYAYSRAFLRSKTDFLSYLQDSDNGLALPDEAILDLFDSRHNATKQLVNVGRFLDRVDKEAAPEVPRNLIVYYVGHGYFSGQRQEYHVALASLTTGYESTTGLKLTDLADVIKDKGRGFRRFVFLDCCFAAEALPDFMGAADDAMATKAQAAFAEDAPKRPVDVPRRGTALFCAADKDHVALSPATLKRTMFSDALLEALANGDEHIPTDLSLADVRDLTWERLQRHSPPVRPVLHSPDQTQGDIAKAVLLFPNVGHRMAMERANAAAKKAIRQAEQEKLKAENDQRIRQEAREREEASELQETELWQEALRKGTLEAYQAYLDTSTRLAFRQSAEDRLAELRDIAEKEAEERREGERWQAAQKNHTLAGYQDYLNASRFKTYQQAAEEQITELKEAARRLAEKEAAEAEAQRKATEKEAEERREVELWQAAQKNNTLLGYQDYLSLSQYKTYRQAAEEQITELKEAARRLAEKAAAEAEARRKAAEKEAEERREVELWQAARANNTLAGYQDYLNASPYKTYQKAAEEQITELKEAARRLAEKEAEVEAQKKDAKKEAEELREALLWQTAWKNNTLVGYQDYLSLSQYKTYQQAAEERITELKEAARRLAEEAAEVEAQKKAAGKRKADENKNILGLGLGVLVALGILWVVSASTPSRPARQPEPVPAPAAAPAAIPALPAKPVAAIAPAAPNYAAKQIFQDAFLDGSGQGPKMVVIPAGSFLMGSPDGKNGTVKEEGRYDNEGPLHSVSVAKFALAQTEVTVGQFRAFVAETGYRTDAEENRGGSTGCNAMQDVKWDWRAGVNWRKPGFAQGDDHPVVCVSWNDSRKYVEWLSQKTGQSYELPSEAQWEYAARGGSSTARFWGQRPSEACAWANVADQGDSPDGKNTWPVFHECRDGYWFTAPTGHFKPNDFGLYDMIGNAWEWVQDSWHDNYKGAPSDGSVWEDGGAVGRVLRGGSWVITPQFARSAYRVRGEPAYRNDLTGLRPARMLP